MFGVEFAHSDQADIGQVGSAVGIPRSQFGEPRKFAGQVECGLHKAIAHEIQNHACMSEVKRGLSQYGLARQQRF